MKINIENSTIVSFDRLHFGDVFVYDGELHVKLKEDSSYDNAISLGDDGSALIDMDGSESCILVKEISVKV